MTALTLGRAEAFQRAEFALPEGRMAALRFGDAREPAELLFLHANGLNARTYASLLTPLAEKIRILAPDLRGHGRSALPSRLFGYASWNRHRDDVIALISAHVGRPVVLAGHSLGATTALLVAGARPDLVRGLCLIEPVILPPPAYMFARAPGAPLLFSRMRLVQRARKRRSRFATAEEAGAALRGRGVFERFSEEAFQGYLADGLLADGEGVRLACRPAYEAATYAAQRHTPFRAWRRAPGGIVLLRAERGSTTPAPVARSLAKLRPDARIAMVGGSGHMLPLERPDRARAAIETAYVLSGLSNRAILD